MYDETKAPIQTNRPQRCTKARIGIHGPSALCSMHNTKVALFSHVPVFTAPLSSAGSREVAWDGGGAGVQAGGRVTTRSRPHAPPEVDTLHSSTCTPDKHTSTHAFVRSVAASSIVHHARGPSTLRHVSRAKDTQANEHANIRYTQRSNNTARKLQTLHAFCFRLGYSIPTKRVPRVAYLRGVYRATGDHVLSHSNRQC